MKGCVIFGSFGGWWSMVSVNLRFEVEVIYTSVI